MVEYNNNSVSYEPQKRSVNKGRCIGECITKRRCGCEKEF